LCFFKFSECKGSLKLHHHENSKLIHIDSGKIRNKGRGKRSISARGMKYAELSGACCWEVRKRKYGGEFRHLKTVETHSLPLNYITTNLSHFAFDQSYKFDIPW
jgi:hypothetical protein